MLQQTTLPSGSIIGLAFRFPYITLYNTKIDALSPIRFANKIARIQVGLLIFQCSQLWRADTDTQPHQQ